MSADVIYHAVPTLTKFTLVRSKLPVEAKYATPDGRQMTRNETGGRSFKAELTTFKPIVKKVGDELVVTGYLDLGVDEFKYLGEPVEGAEPGDTPMDKVLSDDDIQSMRDVLVEVMTESIPDFASQSEGVKAVGVKRYFNVDRIEFFGRDDQPKSAYLRVLLGVYGDEACTDLKTFVQQDFASASKIAELNKTLTDGKANVTKAQAEVTTLQATIDDTETTLEQRKQAQDRKAVLLVEIERVSANIANVQKEVDQLQPLKSVFDKPALGAVVKALTQSVLEDAKANKPPYKDLNVPGLLSMFDGAFASLAAAIAKV